MPRSASIAAPGPTRLTAGALRQPLVLHLCLAATFAIAAIPLLITELPPVFDYPNHLARAHILLQWDSTPAFQSHFTPDTFLLPNVLADLVVVAVAAELGVELAGRLLLLLTMGLTLSGVYVLGRVIAGRYSIWPLFAAALLYNEMFFWGFLTYNLGLAVLPWGLAAWIHFADRPAIRLALATLASFAIFFAHLVAFGLFVVAVLIVELWRAAPWRADGVPAIAAIRRLALAGVPFMPVLALYVAASPTHDLALNPYFDFSLAAKLGPFTRLLSSGNPVGDCLLLAALAGLALTAWRRRIVRVEPPLLAVAGTFAALVLVLPFSAKGSYFLDARIAIAAAFILAAAAVPIRNTATLPLLAATLLIALVSGRSIQLAVDWKAQEARYAEVVAAFERVPRGSLVVPAAAHPFEIGDWTATRHIKPAHEHTAGYAVIARQAIVPNVFARRGQNPLVFDPALEAMAPLGANPITRVLDEDELRGLIDQAAEVAARRKAVEPDIPGVYVLVYHLACRDWPADLEVRAAACGDEFSLVEVIGADSGRTIAEAPAATRVRADDDETPPAPQR